jgi:hypothetical protein
MTATSPQPTESKVAKLRRPPYRNALVVLTIAITMASLFAISYSLALGRPTPHHVPANIVGRPGAAPLLVTALEQATKNGLELIPAASVEAARRAIGAQRVYAALILTSPRPHLLLASAAGTSVARLLEQAATRAAAESGRPLVVTDLRPLPSTDPQGLVSFYVTLAATILGFVSMFQLRANAQGMPLRGWLSCILGLALVGGLVLALVVDPLLSALQGPFPELWAALSAQIAVAALFNTTMLTLIGRWAMIPTWGLFVALGNAASGGAVAPPLLPAFYGFIGRYLPTGATIEIIRNAVYFTHEQHLGPILVEALWLAGTLAAFLTVARLRGHTPETAIDPPPLRRRSAGAKPVADSRSDPGS